MGRDEGKLEEEKGEGAGIYAVGEGFEGWRPSALPGQGDAKPGGADTSTQITIRMRGQPYHQGLIIFATCYS